MRRPVILIAISIISIITVGITACRGRARNAFVAHGPLPPPPSGPLKFVGRPPEHPFHRAAGNIFTRTIFQTTGPSNSQIEVRDLLIPPHVKTQIAALPGPAVLDVYTGSARISSGEKPESIGTGTMRSLPAGTAVQVENPDAHPMMLRLYLIQSR